MTEKVDRLDIVIKILIVFFFSALLFRLTIPIFDSDFWWHLASGRWMWEYKSLLHDDPFAVPVPFSESPLRKEFILKQYWLSQLMFHGTYSLAGFHGIIFLRAFVLTAMFYTLYCLIRNEGGGRILSVFFIFLSSSVIIDEFHYVGARPQMWTSLFAIVVVYLLEGLRKERKWTFAALPALMLLWANMHGGFVLGDVVIIVYLTGTLISRSGKKMFYIVCCLSLVVSGLNPKGFTAFIGVFLTFLDVQSLEYWKSIVETQSIFTHASISGVFRRLPHLTAIFIVSLLSFLLNIRQIKKMRLELALLYLLVFLMGLKAIRYIVFFAAIASFITAINVKSFWQDISSSKFLELRTKVPKAVSLSLTVIIIVIFSAQYGTAGMRLSALTSKRLYDRGYQGAVNFIKESNLRGNMFNDYNYGGFLIWWLSPEIRVFIDGRNLYNSFPLYRSVVDSPFTPASRFESTPIYSKVLDAYGIDQVLMSGCDDVSGSVMRLPLALLKDRKWSLVYADARALLFVRDTPQNRPLIQRHTLPDTVAYNQILSLAARASRSGHGHMMANWKLSLAIAYEGRGEKEKALFWVNEYLKLIPRDRYAFELKRKIEEALQKLQ